MSDRNLSDLSIAELNERKNTIGDGGGVETDHIDEELSRREQERAREVELLTMKLRLKQAKDAGLGDDPTVAAVEDHVDALSAALHPDPRSELAAFADIDKAQVAGLSDAEAEHALEKVEAIKMTAGSSTTAMRASLEDHVEALQELLTDHDVGVEALSDGVLPADGRVAVSGMLEADDNGGV